MHTQCTVCSHPRVTDIDRDLLAGAVTVPVIAERSGLSKSALYRHRLHLQERLHKAREHTRSLVRTELLMIRLAALTAARKTLAQTLGSDHALALAAIARITRLTVLIDRDYPELDDPTLHHLLTCGSWEVFHTVIPADPELLSRLRRDIRWHLHVPCPASDELPTAEKGWENPPEDAPAEIGTGVTPVNNDYIQDQPPPEPGGDKVEIGWESGDDDMDFPGPISVISPPGVDYLLSHPFFRDKVEEPLNPAFLLKKDAPAPRDAGLPAPPAASGPSPLEAQLFALEAELQALSADFNATISGQKRDLTPPNRTNKTGQKIKKKLN